MLRGAALSAVGLVASLLVACAQSSTSRLPDINSAGVSSFQSAILSDGVVTPAEYREAVSASRDCVVARGWKTSPLHAGIDGVSLTYSILAGRKRPNDAVLARIDVDRTACVGNYLDDVEAEYLRSRAPSGQERDTQLRDLVACLKLAGVDDVSETFTEVQFVKAIVKALSPHAEPGFFCMDTHASLFR